MKTHDELVAEVAADAGYRNEFLHLLKLRNTIQTCLRQYPQEATTSQVPDPKTKKYGGRLTYAQILDATIALFGPQVDAKLAGYVHSLRLLQDALTSALRIRYTLTPEQADALLNDVAEKYAED